MLSKTELAKALADCRRRVGGNLLLKERRRNNILRVMSISQFNCAAAERYNKAMAEYRHEIRQGIPSRAMYFFYDRKHQERRTGYVLACGSTGHKWFARKCDADAALLAMLNADK
jgi:hypothetical protein